MADCVSASECSWHHLTVGSSGQIQSDRYVQVHSCAVYMRQVFIWIISTTSM